MIGQTISHYKILEHLGGGGMGVVYKAEDTRLKRIVALKFLPAELTRDPDAKQRFIHEAQAASALQHNNICNVHDIDETPDGQLFIVMDFYEGETLKKKIERGPLKIEEAVDIAIQVAQGLAKAHEHGIVHRDIKPANVMVTSDSVAKIVDFGLAKLSRRTMLTKAGSTLGTAGYMSPEQARGEVADSRTDIWSLGVVLYEMLTGLLPFRGEYEQGIIYKILNEDPAPITSARTGIHLELERIVDKCLEKRRDERYQSAVDLIADLRHLYRTIDARTETTQRSTATAGGAGRRTRWWYWTVPVVVIGIIAVVLILQMPRQATVHEEKSIAVLPFVDMSPQKDQDYFCEGITEELINRLSKIQYLKVAARTSTFMFKGKTEDIRDIGSKLSVRTVLEGSVRKAGNRIRITAQLINVADGFHLWSETYDRDMQDVFATQDQIARAIVSAFRITLGGAEEARLTRHSTENTEAFQLYLRGRYYLDKRTEAAAQNAIEYFEKATVEDPEYALAYVGLADSWSIMGWYRWTSPQEAYRRANAAARRALQIDSSLPEAHTSLAHVRETFNWDWTGAEVEYKRALELNPNYSTARHWYSLFLVVLGRMDEALEEARRAQQLDPLSLIINENLGDVLGLAGRYDEAIEQLRKTIELDSNFAVARWSLVRAYFGKGSYDDGVREYLRSVPPEQVSALEQAYATSGIRGLWEKDLQLTTEMSRKTEVSPIAFARLYALLGKKDEAFIWLERAFADRSTNLAYVRRGYWFDSLRSDPRFAALLKKAGLEK